MTDPIIDKIRKLLALAERGGTEAEALVAMSKVQELLTKHNLSLSSIAQGSESTMTREVKDYPWNQSWIKAVYAGIARLYFCKCYVEHKGTEKLSVYLIGEPVNIATATYVADVVIAACRRQAKEYATMTRKEFGGTVGEAISASNGFKKGFAGRINQRCAELIKEATVSKPNENPGNALVVADFYKKNDVAINEFMKTIGLRLVSGRGMGQGDSNHMSQGAGAANSVNLRSAGLSASNNQFLIGGR